MKIKFTTRYVYHPTRYVGQSGEINKIGLTHYPLCVPVRQFSNHSLPAMWAPYKLPGGVVVYSFTDMGIQERAPQQAPGTLAVLLSRGDGATTRFSENFRVSMAPHQMKPKMLYQQHLKSDSTDA